MKILIISSGRAGSNSLSRGLQSSLNNHKLVIEPFNNYYFKNNINPSKYDLSEPNLIVKTLSFHGPTNLFHYIDINLIQKQTIDFLLEYSSNFSKIILLGRKNKIQTAKSWQKLFTSQFYNKSPLSSLPYSDFLSHVSYSELILEIISNIKNIPITYYEDIFNGNKNNINTFLNSYKLILDNNNLHNFLNPKGKYK